ncbi:MAG TPA: efflux RND transporter periplasmic adaptor subunit [Salinimicrobium sp.]|nr:efflux RND transporter periplasmic adaptor subunit [Salinimicrobium sp.]
MKTKNKNIFIVLGSVFFGLILGWIVFSGGNDVESHEHETAAETENIIWTCSMHPQIREDEPGQCPLCGMDLTPLEHEHTSNSHAVQMSEHAIKLANIQTMIVGESNANAEVRLNGKISVNEQKSYVQSSHIPGRIEKLFVDFTGEEVKRGQALASIYSPEMQSAQEELLQAQAIRETNPELFEAAKTKLRNWRIGENQIQKILETGKTQKNFTITADVNGIVTEKLVEVGDYIERGMPIYQIADLSNVWVVFDLYESNLNFINEGDIVGFTVASLPGESFKGKIDFVDPILNQQTRVSSARLEVDNKAGKLKPGMFVTGILKNSAEKEKSNQISIPKSSVLWTGKRSVVYVKEETGFELREVLLGNSLGNSYIIIEGLKAGEEIVVNGTFTVDAAAQLAGKPSMMSLDK